MRPLLLTCGLTLPVLALQAQGAVFEATATAIRPGQSVGLRWEVPGGGQVRLEPGGLVLGSKGTLTVKPAGTTTYVLTSVQGGGALGRLTVKVDPGAVLGEPARVCSFVASSAAVMPGEPVVLKWECVGDAKVRLEPGGLELDGTSEITVTPLESTRYVLSVTNLAGGMSRALEVKVRPRSPLGDPAQVCSFRTDKPLVRPGEPVELTWECQGESSVRLEPGGLELTGQNRILVQPSATTVYTLSVSNLAGGMTRSLEVKVEEPPTPAPEASAGPAPVPGDLPSALRTGQALRATRLQELPQAWTLRLVVSGHAPGFQKVLRAAGPDAANLMVLPYVRRDGFRWWQACYGTFPTRTAALQAWARSPENLRKAFGEPLLLRLERLPGDLPKAAADAIR
jgi:hypothetical protein